MASPVYAAGATVRGRVVDDAGNAVAGACVTASFYSSTSVSTTTAADGSFRLDGVQAGTTFLSLDLCQTAAQVAPQWYRDQVRRENSSGITVADGGDYGDFVITAAKGGSISGRVTNSSGAAMPGECVNAYADDTEYFFARVSTKTKSDGTYQLTRLPAYPFHVQVVACNGTAYATTYAPSAATPESARTITPTAGAETTGVDVVVSMPSKLTGSTRAADGSPLAGQCVELRSYSTITSGRQVSNALSGSDGTWSMPQVAAGDYRVRVADCATGLHVAQWFNGSSWGTDTTASFHIDPGTTKTLPALTAPPAGIITGSATNDTGAAVGVCPFPYIAAGGQYLESNIDHPTGRYSVGGLPPGRYNIEIHECTGSPTYTAWVGGDDRRSTAAAIEVVGGQATTADAVLPRPATITGTLRDEGGVAMPGCVLNEQQRIATTASNGTYVSQALYPREMTVYFSPPCSSGSSGPVRYDPTVVTLHPGQTETGVDGTAPATSGLSGHVHDSAGNPVWTCVAATSGSGIRYDGNSDFTGGWRLDGLPAGTYTIEFRICSSGGPNLVTTYYPSAQKKSDATPVTLESAAVTGLDAVMRPGLTISGTVTDSAGRPFAEACVNAGGVDGNPVSEGALTGADGTYTVSRLPQGTYKLVAQACTQGDRPGAPATTWYPSAAHSADATPISLSSNRSGADIRLIAGGVRRGLVLDSAGQPVSACIWLNSGENSRSAYSGADGRWVMYGVGDSSYAEQVIYDCSRGRYVANTQYVTTHAGQDEDTGPVVLLRAGSISGTAINENGAPVADLCVDANGDVEHMTRSNADGSYRLGGLLPGAVKVRFYDCGGRELVVPEYWHDKATVDAADPVVVQEGQDTGGISPTLTDVQLPSVVRDVTAVAEGSGTKVSWTEPADDGHAPITSYVVRNASTGGSVATTEGWQRSVTVGSDAGTSFTVEAVNRKGPGPRSQPASRTQASSSPSPTSSPSATASPTPSGGAGGDTSGSTSGQPTGAAPQPGPSPTPSPVTSTGAPSSSSTVHLTAPASVLAGSSTTITAVLTSGAALSGRTVRLLARPAGVASSIEVMRGVTNRNGGISFTLVPMWSTRYTAVFDGDASNEPGSASIAVRVVPRVVGRLVASTARLGSTAVANVTSRGIPPGHRTVLQVRRADGSWVTVTTGYLSSSGAVRLTWRPARRATYTFRVVVPLANGIPAATSASFAFRVT